MGVALATIETLHQHAEAPRKVRISVRVKNAVDLMVDKARSRAEAAKEAGLTDDALYRALTKPEVQAYRHDRLRVLRSSEASRTISRAADLADKAESEHVRLQANTWLHEIEHGKPTQRIETSGRLDVRLPGLQIVIAHRQGAQLIDSQAHEVEDVSDINALPQAVPHPAIGNAADREADPVPADRDPRGVK